MTFSAENADEFTINIAGQVRAGFYAIDDDDGVGAPAITDNSNGFDVWAARLRLSGNVFNKNITYFLQGDFAGDSAANDRAAGLVDGWAGWQMSDSVNLRLGQQKMRSSLQADASLSDNVGEMAWSSIATSWFAGNRSTGALLEGNSGNVNWHFGAMNNSTAGVDSAADPISAAPPTAGGQRNAGGENELNYTLGVSVGSDSGNSESWTEGDLAHAGNSSWISGASILLINEGADEDSSINLYAGWKSGSGVAAQAEIFIREDETYDSEGFYGQLSYTMPSTEGVQYGGAARYSMLDVDGAEVSEISLGVNAYYHEHALKSQLQVSSVEADRLDGDIARFDLLFTLMF